MGYARMNRDNSLLEHFALISSAPCECESPAATSAPCPAIVADECEGKTIELLAHCNKTHPNLEYGALA
jgi:hypothetical protein